MMSSTLLSRQQKSQIDLLLYRPRTLQAQSATPDSAYQIIVVFEKEERQILPEGYGFVKRLAR